MTTLPADGGGRFNTKEGILIMSKDIIALSAARSAVGGFGGSLSTPPEELGAIVAREAFVRAGIDGAQATYAVVGNVIPCGLTFPSMCRVS